MIIVITYKNGEVEKIESNKIRIVGSSDVYIGEGEEEKSVKLDQITYVEVEDN